MRGTVTDARTGGDSGRGGRRRDSTVVIRPRLCVCGSSRYVYFAGLGSGVLHARYPGGGDSFSGFSGLSVRVCPRDDICMRVCQRRYASPSSPSCPRSGFKQPLASMKGRLNCLRECASSRQFRQWPPFSRSAAGRVVVVCRPLHRGGSSVWMDEQRLNTSA